MCFIIAKIGNKKGFMKNDDLVDLSTLIREAEVSGGHGRGFYGSKQGLFKTMKGIKKSKNLILEAFNNNMSILYHTRYATHGKVKIENNHPFSVIGKKHSLVGVHNGSFYLTKEQEDSGKTDSEIFFQYLADNGIEKAVDEYYYNGWGAFIWYELNERKWYAIKFGGNLEAQITEFGLIVATRNLWSKFYDSNNVQMSDLVLYELLPDGIKKVKRINIYSYYDKKYGCNDSNKYEERENRYGYWNEKGKWVKGYDKKSPREAGKDIIRRLEGKILTTQEQLNKEINEIKSMEAGEDGEEWQPEMNYFSAGGKIFQKNYITGEIKEEVIDELGNVHFIPIPIQ